MDELRLECITRKPDIVVVTESWLSTNHDNDCFLMNDYTLFRQDRTNKIGGGILVWMKHSIPTTRVSPVEVSHIGDFVFLSFKFCAMLYILCANCIPPNRTVSEDESINDSITNTLDSFCDNHPNCYVIICGDFNRLDTSLLESSYDLVPKVTSPTRGAAILDQVLVSNSLAQHYKSAEVGPPPFSGRRGSHCQVLLNPAHDQHSEDSIFHTVYDCRLPNLQEFITNLSKCSFADLYREPDMDKKTDIFYERFCKCLSVIPSKQITMTMKDKPWMSPLLKDLITQRWNAFRSKNFAEYNRLKRKCKELITLRKKSWYETERLKSRNPWSVVKETCNKGSNNPLASLLFQYPDSKTATDAINEQLCKAFTKAEQFSLDIDDDDWCPLTDVPTVCKFLESISCKKSTGSDGIPNRFYKLAAPFISEPLCHIINTSISERKVPCAFKQCHVSPIPKSAPAAIDNLRPITLLSIPSKLLEHHVLCSVKPRILPLFPKTQFAYKPKSDTTSALVSIHDHLTSQLDKHNVNACILISYDFSKAFDSVSHKNLLKKLLKVNLPSGFVLWLQSYLASRTQRTRVKNVISSPCQVTSGTPQGSLLAPYLFVLYCQDIKPLYDDTHISVYADDISEVLSSYLGESTDEFVDRVNTEYEHIVSWALRNDMSVNRAKTKGMVVPKRGQCLELSLPFPTVDNLKLLGVIFSSNLSWNPHFLSLYARCSKRLYILRVLKTVLSHDDLWLVYDSLIDSLLLYAAPLFGMLSAASVSMVERIFRRARRMICSSSCGCSFSFDERHFSKRCKVMKSFAVKALASDHPLYDIMPNCSNRSCRLIVPHAKTNRRRNCFTVLSAIMYS